MKRIGIAQIIQESNSFTPKRATLSDFEPFGIALGDEVVSRYGDSDETGGFADGLKSWDEAAEPVGLIRAHGWSYGPLSRDTRQWFADRLREQLEAVGELDGLLLALHGSLVAEDEDDVEGSFLDAIRSVVGPNILTDNSGPASPHFAHLPFHRINRPLWPIDEIEDWEEVDWARHAV